MRSPALKIVLSILIFYHMAVVLILPNSYSLIARRWSRYLVTYANTFGLNTPWEFFSPAPAPTMYLQYQIDRGGALNQNQMDNTVYYFPPLGPKGTFNSNQNRLLYAMRFFILDPERLERYFVPWVCRNHPDAVTVSVQHIIEPVENIEKAGIGKSFQELSEKMQVQAREYNCRDLGATQ